MLAEKSAKHPEKFSEAWNFGPNDHDAVSVEFIAKYISSKTPGMLVESHEGDHPHEATLLKLDISKSRGRLNWMPKWSVTQALDKVLDWHEAFEAGHDMYEKSMEHIRSYEQF
jgi:CDP-glucose 4,6-dehydratase